MMIATIQRISDCGVMLNYWTEKYKESPTLENLGAVEGWMFEMNKAIVETKKEMN